MALNYEINANLRLRGGGGGFQRTMSRMSDRVRSFADRLRGARSLAGGLVRSLVSLGAGYIGFHAISSGIRTAIGGMLEFNNQVESTRIGMQTILSAVDGISFDAAGESADRIFRQLQDDAITSIATGQDLAQIFSGIVGPIRAAGGELEQVRQITLQTATAAAAAGVDFAQAQRDINLMVQGTAGMDTRLFAVLRSMGRITQSTEEWNQQLTAGERIAAIQEALSAFEPGGAAFGQSMQGLVATFKGLLQAFGRAFSGPAFERIKAALSDVNDFLITNRDRIEAFLVTAGERLAQALDLIFDRAAEGFQFVIDHWDQISNRMQELGTVLREQAPHIARMAAAMGAISTLRTVLAPILTVISSVMSMFEGGGLLAGLFGGGEAAAAAGGAGAGAAEAGAAGASAALGPLVAALAAFAGVAVVVATWWDDFLAAFQALIPMLEPMGRDIMAIGMALWEILRPILKIIGTTILVTVVPTLMLMLTALRGLLIVLRVLVEVLAWVASAIEEYLIDPIIGFIVRVGRAIAEFMGETMGDHLVSGGPAEPPSDPRTDRLLAQMEEGGPTGRTGFGLGGTSLAESVTPGARPQTVNNFHRGSVTVRQEFSDADPDRVMVRMVNDIDAQAERRIQSGFAPALTR